MKIRIVVSAVFFVCAISANAFAQTSCRCLPVDPCWPKAEEWKKFGSQLKGKLEQPQSPLEPCRIDASSESCVQSLKNLTNPFYIEDQPGGTQSRGWLEAWNAAQSIYSVAAESAQDVAAAVNFARSHKLKLVIKGTGHDYLGRSNAPDSLLIWTHKMRQVNVLRNFVPQGCPKNQKGISAVTVGAGTRWLEAYHEVTTKHGRYVQGGGCASVGAAGGFTQGGGFGSFSKKYGTGAAGILQVEVVTADGKVVIANACQNQDLFWAMRGGGGGTFGVVTQMTLQTHELPQQFGLMTGRISANSDAAFLELLKFFVQFYGQKLNNEFWGEQVLVRSDNTLELSLVFQGMTRKEAEDVWLDFRKWIEKKPKEFSIQTQTLALPARKIWDFSYLKKHYPEMIQSDPRVGQPGNLFWWSSNQGEVSKYWYTYQSRWIPQSLFAETSAQKFAQALFDASKHWPLSFHFNKGQAGASLEAVRRVQETSMNPAVFQAAALMILGAGMAQGYPEIKGHEPNSELGKAQVAKVSAAMKIIRELTPGAGTYGNEADYFEPNWQTEFWGENYPKLLKIKQKYDPEGLFFCHHCVGSESWSKDGICRIKN